MRIGHLLKAWREVRGLSHKAAGEVVGVKQSSWTALEHDQSVPKGDTVAQLLKHGIVTPEDLVDPERSDESRGAAE